MVKIEKVSYPHCTALSEESHYPYGTCLTLENEVVDKLDIGALKPGDIVEVKGYAVIESIRQSADSKNSDKSVSMQLTEISINREQADRAVQLYSGS